ncbi:MAG: DNA methyltransferase [Planctomycetota bacterium]
MSRTDRLFSDDAPNATRQPKTDPLVLARLLDEAAADRRYDDTAQAVHPLLLKWADLESSGQLAATHETQLQGPFCEEVLGEALGYPSVAAAGPDASHLLRQEQHIPNVGPADAVLGEFRPNQPVLPAVRAVVELKGPAVHLDRSRSSGKTAVEQCWYYMANAGPSCRFGIVSNFISFRLYDRVDATPRQYEHYSLQSLRDFATFRRFFATFHATGLIKNTLGQKPRVVELITRTRDRQRAVGDDLYQHYSTQRTKLIEHLIAHHNAAVDDAIEMAQRLVDRVVFIAFCEDRGLLPERSLARANKKPEGFTDVTNPCWRQFKQLFRFVDRGGPDYGIPQYNGGLFAPHPCDDLDLPDTPWADFFASIGKYGFADEVNLDVLGHLFERSITELEKLKTTGVFTGDLQKARQYAEMPQSAKRKRLGVYYTPAVLTERVVRDTLDELIAERFELLAEQHDDPDRVSEIYWRQCFECLRQLKVLDPACGSGAFLFQAYRTLELRYGEVLDQLRPFAESEIDELQKHIPRCILNDNLYGVDLSPEAVEISQLALWIQSADRTQTLATLSHNIVHGNSLVSDPDVHPHAFDFRKRFPEVFDRDGWNNSGGGFDCIVGNPPWDKIKVPEREFFSLTRPDIATTPKADKRAKLVAALATDDPPLLQSFEQAKQDAKAVADFCRESGSFPLTGKGEINTYAVFTELGERLVAPLGRVGLIIPTALATKKTTSAFFAHLAEKNRLIRLYDFSNRNRIFEDVNPRENFSIFCFGGAAVSIDEADFVFRSVEVEEVENPKRHVKLPGDAITLVNPNTQTAPVFKTTRDARLTYDIYRRVPILIDKRRKKTGNSWGINFNTIFHQTNDAHLFREANELKAEGFTLDGNVWRKGEQAMLPVYEAKMCRPYNHRYANIVVDESAWMMQGRSAKSTSANLQSPEYLVLPRYWVTAEEVHERASKDRPSFIGFRDIARNDDTRTFLAKMVPYAAATNKLPIIVTRQTYRRETCLLGNFCSFVFDYVVRQKLGDTTMNYFIVEQFPVLPPDRYDEPCPWAPRTTLETWIAERVLKLTCTAEDMLPLAEACGFTGGSFKEYEGKLHKWNPRERAQLLAELDAAYFHLYGLSRDDAAYTLSTFKGIHASDALLGGVSVADHLLDTYDVFAAAALGGVSGR